MRLAPSAASLRSGFEAIRHELGLPDAFPFPYVPKSLDLSGYADATGVDLVTIDPPGSRDLDQAYWARRTATGFEVTYAIADVAAFVAAGDPLDVEARRRGATLYAPDARVLLYPPELSEGAASLLPGRDRPALLWRFDLDATGEPASVDVRRARVRSRAQLDYPGVQRDLDAGTATEPLQVLREVGLLRLERERDRGGVSLHKPAQEVVATDGGYALAYVTPLPVEDWNAQVSLLTGICAARIMLDGGAGLLRTMPPPDPKAVEALRRSASGLGVPWPTTMSYATFIRSLDSSRPAAAALLDLAARTMRGAGYTAFDGAPPEPAEHSAIAAPYAHVTAPLRRLADRYANEVVLALHAGTPVPEWARAALPLLPPLMAAASHRDRELERADVDYVEAAVLAGRVGETFDATVVEPGLVQVREPAVRAAYDGHAPLGAQLRVRLLRADPVARQVRFGPG